MAGSEWHGHGGEFRYYRDERGEHVNFESKSKQDCLRRRQVIEELLKKKKEKERMEAKPDFGPSSSSNPSSSRPSTRPMKPMKPVRPLSKEKLQTVQRLKDGRDFGFLFNEGGTPCQKPASSGNSARVVRTKVIGERKTNERKASEPRKPSEERLRAGKLAQEILKSNSCKPPVKQAGSTTPSKPSTGSTTPSKPSTGSTTAGKPSSGSGPARPSSTTRPAIKTSNPSRPPTKKVNAQAAQKLKEGRDFSFLFDEDNSKALSKPEGNKDSKMPPRSTEKKVISTSTKTSKPGQQSKPIVSHTQSKPATTTAKTIAKSPPAIKQSLPDKRLLDKKQNRQGVKRPVEDDAAKPALKRSKPLPTTNTSRPSAPKPQKKPVISKKDPAFDRRFERSPSLDDLDEKNLSSYISKMFRKKPYNDVRSSDDGCSSDDASDDASDASDASNMEVGFSGIQREEAISARIARQEDEEQQKLIEAEEEEERQAKLRKKRKKIGK